MTYADIFLHLDNSDGAEKRVDYALALAKDQNAHLTGYAISATPAAMSYGIAPVPLEMVTMQQEIARGEAELAIKNFEKRADQSEQPSETLTMTGVIGLAIRELAMDTRHADLMITGQPLPETGGYSIHRQLIEEMLFSAGRPVLVVPYIGANAVPPKNVLVAWDGSREVTQAVHDALPLLRKADRVTIMVVDPDKRPDRHGEEPGANIGRHLARHGLDVTVAQEVSAGLHIGEFLISRIADGGHDLLVMGGYSHSRLREMILGGVTRTLLDSMTVPVFLSH